MKVRIDRSPKGKFRIRILLGDEVTYTNYRDSLSAAMHHVGELAVAKKFEGIEVLWLG